jgi:hypothetical protein
VPEIRRELRNGAIDGELTASRSGAAADDPTNRIIRAARIHQWIFAQLDRQKNDQHRDT